ncbi:hypothetical protein ACFB49_09740 [Sphingomonas sp. DBB INV C78]|uniref:TonB-dependent receptor n=1 Tax=Sphingomonas sp. DBB INV C78 TaxID=3349434 RepID=UPI0036D42A1D
MPGPDMRRLKARYAHFLLPCLALGPAVAQAQEGELSEIIVTAERKAESLQDAPISIIALDSTALAKIGATGLSDITNSVPNLQQITWGVGNTTLRFYIRGVGQTDNQLLADSAVGVYVDGVYIARTSGLATNIPDIDRIEVLRGPQGALYGRNTTGGAINIITKRPNDELSALQTLRLGNYGYVKSTTVVNLPLAEGLAVRGSFLFDKRDGTTTNAGVGNDFNERNNKAARFDARWQPTSTLTADYAYDYSKYRSTADLYYIDVVSPGFAGILPEQKHRVSVAQLPSPVQDSHTKSQGHALTLTLDTDVGTLKSISAYRKLNFQAYQDYSGNSFLNIFRNLDLRSKQKQFTQEVNLVGETKDGAFSYVAGLYYFRETGEEFAVDEIGLINLLSPRHIGARNTAYAGYATLGWRPNGTSPFSITVGGRYTKDKREADNHIVPEVSSSYSKFTPSIVVDYQIAENASVYGKIATGYNAGGYNMRAADFTSPFGPESLTSYELGLKSELFNRRLRVNAAVFYSDYKDIQFTITVPDQPDPAFTQTLNAGKSAIYGAELDVNLLITDDLIASFSYGYLGSDYKQVPLGDSTDLYHAANAPKHSLRTSLDWKLLHLDDGEVSLFMDYTWQDKTHTSPRDAFPGVDLIPAYDLANAQIRFDRDIGAKSKISFSLWMKNIFDQEYYVDSLNIFQALHAYSMVRYGDPRTAGIEFEFRF